MRRAPGSLLTSAAAALTIAAALGVLPSAATTTPVSAPAGSAVPGPVQGSAVLPPAPTPEPTPTDAPPAASAPTTSPAPTTPAPTTGPTPSASPAPAASPAAPPRASVLARARRVPHPTHAQGPTAAKGAPRAKGGAAVDNTQVLHDTFGQRVDAHDGDLLQAPDGTLYLYGTAYGCGFTLGVASPYCGVRVYTTQDLSTFTPAGAVGGQYAFNHLAADWQAICSPPTRFGCYRPQVIRRPADGRYVMWVNVHHDEGYRVLVSDHPAGPFEDTGVVPDLAVEPPTGGLRYGDMDLVVDASTGSVYLTYTAIYPDDNAHDLVVEQLDATATTGTGTHVVLDTMPGVTDLVEAPALFRAPTGTWHMIYSDPARPYWTTGTGIMDGVSPLGPWTAPRTLNATSCGGQPTGAWPVVGPSGSTTWVWATDRWDNGKGNQARANNYYGRLTFTANGGTAIDAAPCQDRWTLS